MYSVVKKNSVEMSNNIENERLVSNSKLYPIDLASPKITIVKNVGNNDMKMAHILPGQAKSASAGQLITHTGSVGLMRPSAQILSSGVVSQSQMIVSGSPVLQGAQIISQGSQIMGQSPQIISQPQLIGTGPLLSPPTQIISQGQQLHAQVSSGNLVSGNIQASVPSSVPGAQVLSVGGSLVTGATNLVVSSSVRTLPASVRVLPPLLHHNPRPATVLSSVTVSNAGGVLVNKNITSHVPRGLAAGASLAVRPVTASTNPALTVQGWGGLRTARGTYSPRPPPRAPSPAAPGVLTQSSVITSSVRAVPTPPTPPSPRPLPLLQRNYQQTKVVGVATAGSRPPVGNSAPPQVYYEVTRVSQLPTVNPVQSSISSPAREVRTPPTSLNQVLSRPTILRKRDSDGSPKCAGPPSPPMFAAAPGWQHVATGGGGGSGGSTTVSAASDAPDPPDPAPPAAAAPPVAAVAAPASPKRPRNHITNNEKRHSNEYQTEQSPPVSPSVNIKPQKRPQLTSTYVCGWRSTALHFVRPSDVRRREPKTKDIVAIASQKHVLNSAEGWKVHHITAQMDDLVSLESDAVDQLDRLLRSLESVTGRAVSTLKPHAHALLELIKGNRQRSKIVSEGIQEARGDILRVFNHRGYVSDILVRQADKRCFRKHRSQS